MVALGKTAGLVGSFRSGFSSKHAAARYASQMNVMELNAYEILYLVGAAFFILIVWVLVKVGKNASRRSKTADEFSPTLKDEDSEA